MTQNPEPRPDPTAPRLECLARVLANPPASRYPCAAGCGQPLTQWHTDAAGRRWHPDCLPPGTPMPILRSAYEMEQRIAELEARFDRIQAIHTPDMTGDSCQGCWDWNGDPSDWPCPTASAINETDARTTLDNPPSSSNTVDNQEQR